MQRNYTSQTVSKDDPHPKKTVGSLHSSVLELPLVSDSEKESFRSYSRKAFGHWVSFSHGKAENLDRKITIKVFSFF